MLTRAPRVPLQGAWEVAAHWRREAPGGGAALLAEGAQSTAVIAALSFWDYSLVCGGTHAERI